jgi:hypothetical protein
MKMKNKAIQQHNEFERPETEHVRFSATTFEKGVDKLSHVEGDVLKDGLLCTEGEALGHNIWLDAQFILDLCEYATKLKLGIKSRLGHPNMCANTIGTFLGRWKDFYVCEVTRDDGTQASALRGNLEFSAAAHKAPAGDLAEYVKTLSEKDGDVFGASICAEMERFFRKLPDGRNAYYDYDEEGYVFGDGTPLTRDERDELTDERYAELYKFTECDIVDSPAANDGMFSAFSNETVAGQITEFLNRNPTVLKELTDNPLIMETIKQHPEEIDGFFSRYNKTKEGNEEMTEEKKKVAKPQTALSPEEFSEIEGKFGTEIAASVFKTGGNSADALELAFAAKEKEVTELSAKITDLEKELSTSKALNVDLETQIKHFEKVPNGELSDFSSDGAVKPKAKLGAKR